MKAPELTDELELLGQWGGAIDMMSPAVQHSFKKMLTAIRLVPGQCGVCSRLVMHLIAHLEIKEELR